MKAEKKRGKKANRLAPAIVTGAQPGTTQEFTHNEIEHEKIAALAYSLYIQEGRPDGHDIDHWLRAEAMLRGGLLDNPELIHTKETILHHEPEPRFEAPFAHSST